MKDARLKLLKTSARIFSQKGYTGTSVREIVAAAKMNVSAVSYYFGDKRSLYLATVKYLANEHHKPFQEDKQLAVQLTQLDTLSHAQTLDLLHTLLNKIIDLGLDNKMLPLERIFTHAALDSSKEMLPLLFSFLEGYHTRPYKIISKLTGLKEKSVELVIITHVIFGQINFSQCHRIALLHDLGQKHFSAQLHTRIKEMVWKNTLAILRLYEKGKKK
ncbi:MAG: TetR family transcriptional regulator [Elusimicrobiaceae bacterium]|nr:TetR family transcriptional regulator [Elusimicrobiaceae bacterium]